MHLKNIMKQEKNTCQSKIEQFEEVIVLNEKFLELLKSTEKVEVKEMQVYNEFISQVIAMLYQAMKNILEGHMTISRFCVRVAIETSCYAAYSLNNYDVNLFYETSDKGIVLKKINKPVFNFCDKYSKEMSERLKDKKSMINEYYSHGNIFSAGKLDKSNTLDGYRHFDKNNQMIEEISLWEINEIVVIVIELLRSISSASEITLRLDVDKYFKYVKESRRLSSDMKLRYNIV